MTPTLVAHKYSIHVGRPDVGVSSLLLGREVTSLILFRGVFVRTLRFIPLQAGVVGLALVHRAVVEAYTEGLEKGWTPDQMRNRIIQIIS